MHLSLLQSDDERLGLPSGSTFHRLVKCPASHALSRQAVATGQAAHGPNADSERGTLIHKAYEMQNAEGLSDSEVADYEAIMAQREETTAQWLTNSAPVTRIAEERLWLHRSFLRPVMSGKVDELLIQGTRGLLFDVKTGRGQMDEPRTNVQLRIYAMLSRVRWPQLESITVAVLSPHFSCQPHTFNAAELDAIRDETLLTLSNLDFESAPRTGEHCRYCPASLICPTRRSETQALAVIAQELPTGPDAARLLEMVGRVETVCESIRAHYKAQLETAPTCVPGWRLVSSVRRWIPEPSRALGKMITDVSVTEFMDECTSVNVANLERLWARKNNVPPGQVRKQFDSYFESVLAEKRIAPSLRQVN